MALNLPTPGESARLGPMRVKAPLVPKTFTPKIGKTPTVKKAAGVNPYDQFTLSDPYAPGKIQGLAQQGWAADTANAQKLAAMGYPTAAETAADYAARGTLANAAQQDLVAHIAGIQQAIVAQGNAGSAALGQQNAAAAASGGNIPGAPPTPGLPTAGAQAVLGAQTAAGGNYYGSLQAASLSSGAQANQRALDAGTVEANTNAQSAQRTLASLLSGVPSESSRESDMLKQNQTVDASNLQTKLNVYQNLVTAKTTADTLGNKTQQAAADRDLKKYIAQMGNTTKVKLGIASANAKVATTNANNRTKAQIAADNRAAAAKRAAAANATSTANNQRTNKTSAANNQRTNAAKGLTASGQAAKRYRVTVKVPGAVTIKNGQTSIGADKTVAKVIPAAVWKKFMASGPQGKRKLAILGVPEGSKVNYNSATGY
jgi:hypothetical protein